MGNRDEEFYLNLSRKDLQALCKKFGLSANKTNFLLARSLVSFFKEKDASSTVSKERLSGPVEVYESDLQLEKPFNSLGETDKVHKGRVEASDADSCRPSFSKEEGLAEGFFQTFEQNHPEAHTSDKVANTAANVAFISSGNIETTEGFSCSTSTPQNDIQKKAPSHLQEIIPCSKVISRCDDQNMEDRKTDHPNSLEQRNSNLNLQNTVSKCCISHIQCRNKTIGGCPAESGLVSSSETSIEPRCSSFQFFVRSEEGINLYVDLNSGPSDWIKILKDEVCMYQKVHNNKSRALHEELKGLGDSGEHSKSSFIGYLETSFQNKEDENNDDSMHGKSSLSSHERGNCHSGLSNQVVGSKMLSSSEKTSNGIPGEVRRHSDEDGQMDSCIRKPDSGLQNQMVSSNLSCRERSRTGPEDSFVAATKLDNRSASVSENSLNCAHNMDANLNLDGPKCLDLLDFETLKTGGLHQVVNDVSEKNSLASSETSLPDIIHHENHSGIGQVSQGSGNMEMQLSEVHVQCENDALTLPYQLTCPLRVELPANDIQVESGRLLDCQLLETCNRYGLLAEGDLTHTFPGEQGQSFAAIMGENSEYSQFDNASETTSKRSNSSELPEEIQNKRHCNSAENENNIHAKPVEKNLESGKNLAREKLRPRRSTRLVSK